MQGLGNNQDEKCPFVFNTTPETFKVGDLVSYRISERFGEMPFIGTLLEVHDDYVTPRRRERARAVCAEASMR
jgi:hypothetical protein